MNEIISSETEISSTKYHCICEKLKFITLMKVGEYGSGLIIK